VFIQEQQWKQVLQLSRVNLIVTVLSIYIICMQMLTFWTA